MTVMSLDFFLYTRSEQRPCECTCGHRHTSERDEYVADFNITHNLGRMAAEAGIYICLWRPEEHDPPITTAAQCIPFLRAGVEAMRARPDDFSPLSAEDGWGTYDQFVPWVERVLAACEETPAALVRVSR